MADFATVAAIFCALATAIHLISAALALSRFASVSSKTRCPAAGPVSIIRPICGLDHFDELTLRSTFELAARNYEVIFCAAREDDAAVPLVRRLIKDYPHIPARLLIGDERPTSNPKLNNIVKGWAAARHPWIVIADNNVLMPQHYLDDLFASFGPGTGLVCSPPIGSRPIGFWAELECAFLNGYQARWQYAADTIGFGFAQGKSMLWRRDMLDVAGGIEVLGAEPSNVSRLPTFARIPTSRRSSSRLARAGRSRSIRVPAMRSRWRCAPSRRFMWRRKSSRPRASWNRPSSSSRRRASRTSPASRATSGRKSSSGCRPRTSSTKCERGRSRPLKVLAEGRDGRQVSWQRLVLIPKINRKELKQPDEFQTFRRECAGVPPHQSAAGDRVGRDRTGGGRARGRHLLLRDSSRQRRRRSLL